MPYDYKGELKQQRAYAKKRLGEMNTGSEPSNQGKMALVLASLFGPNKSLRAVNQKAKKATGQDWDTAGKKAAFQRVLKRTEGY